MRAAAIAHHDEPRFASPPARQRDQPAAAEALVVGMRCDDDEAAHDGKVVEAADGQPHQASEEIIGPHGAQRSGQMACSGSAAFRMCPAALARAWSGAGWRR